MTTRRRPTPAVVVPGALGRMLRNRLGEKAAPPAPPAAPARAGKVSKGRITSLPDKKAEVLSELLQRARTEVRMPRRGKHIHVSDLISRCIRKKAIVEIHNVPIPVQRLSLTDAMTYRQGDAIHDVLKERTVQGAPSQVWGRWRCKCGSLRVDEPCTFDRVDQGLLCEKCEQPAKIYEETEFLDAELNILGHPDLILYLPDLQSYYVTELKSISHEQFKELVRPKPDHVTQVLFYWYLMHRKGMPLVDTVSILYATKGYVFKGKPYLEFPINVKAALKNLDPYLDDARAILRARETGELPPRVHCAAKESPDARACEVSGLCFGEAQAPVQTISFRDALRTGRK